MAKSSKKKQIKKQPPQQISGSFMDILKASAKHAEKNSAKKKNTN